MATVGNSCASDSGETSPVDEVAPDSAVSLRFSRSPSSPSTSVRSSPQTSDTVLSLKTWFGGGSDARHVLLNDTHAAKRSGPFQSSILKSPTLHLTGSQILPVTKIVTLSSPSSSSSSSSSSSAGISTSHRIRQQPVATPHPSLVPYHLVDVEVRLKEGCYDILLQGRVGVVRSIDKKMAVVQITSNSSDITIPHDSLQPVTPRPSDTVKVIGGSDVVLGLIGTLVSTIGKEGVIQFISHDKQRRKNPAQIPLSQLGKYAPKSKFPSGLPSSGAFFQNKIGVIGKSSGLPSAATTATTSGEAAQMLFPLVYAIPTQVQTPLGPFFSTGRPRASPFTSGARRIGFSSTSSSIPVFSQIDGAENGSRISSRGGGASSIPVFSHIDSAENGSRISSRGGGASSIPVFSHIDGAENGSRISSRGGGESDGNETYRANLVGSGSRSSISQLGGLQVDRIGNRSDSAGSSRSSSMWSSGSRSVTTGGVSSEMFHAVPKRTTSDGNRSLQMESRLGSGSFLMDGSVSRIFPMESNGGGRSGSETFGIASSSRSSLAERDSPRITESRSVQPHSDGSRSSQLIRSLRPLNCTPSRVSTSFGRRLMGEKDAVPDSTTNGMERDSVFATPPPKRMCALPIDMTATAAAHGNHPITSLQSNHINKSRTTMALPLAQSRAPSVPFTFPIPLSKVSSEAMMFLKDVGKGASVGRTGGNGGFFVRGGFLGSIGGGGGSNANGYSISEVLEKLVKDQRNYAYELSSPSTPGGSSHDVKTSCVRVSLICPLSQQRMKYPSRGKDCKHLQCFDAENYINFHEKQMMRKKVKRVGHYIKPAADKKWNCPICERITYIPQLYIDKALMKLVNESSVTTEVELSRNGSWVPVSKSVEVEVIDLTDD